MTNEQFILDFYKTPAERRILSFRHRDSSLADLVRGDYFEADLKALIRLCQKGKIWYSEEDGEVVFC